MHLSKFLFLPLILCVLQLVLISFQPSTLCPLHINLSYSEERFPHLFFLQFSFEIVKAGVTYSLLLRFLLP